MKSWNETRKAATAFAKRWKNAYDEKSQAQSFLTEFFAVFGVDAVTVTTFEHRVKFADGSQGYADCFWQGKILVEMKSRGKNLDAAFQQAMDYVRSLPDVSQTPRAIVVSDFQRFRFYNLEKDNALTEFSLKDLRKYVTIFGFMIGAEEYIHGTTRYCIWLVDADVALLNKCPLVKARIEAVRQFRSASKKAATRKKADYPTLFDEVRQPKNGNFIVVPRVTSERRKYVPIGFLSSETVVTDLIQMIPDATLYHFGILSSRMHMAWMRAVAGRLKSDYRYSKDIVYNNFIWPDVLGNNSNNDINNFDLKPGATAPGDKNAARLRGDDQKVVSGCPSCFQIWHNPRKEYHEQKEYYAQKHGDGATRRIWTMRFGAYD